MITRCPLAVALFGALFCLNSCGVHSKNPSTPEYADERIRRRIVDSEQVHVMLSRIEAALAPIDKVVHDIQTAAGASITVANAEARLRQFTLSRLRTVIRDLGRNLMVTRDKDARSWVARRTVTWGFERVSADTTVCSTSELLVQGHEKDDGEFEMIFSVSDCDHEPLSLMTATGKNESDVHVRLSASAFRELLSPEIRVENCAILIERDNRSQVNCEPMSFKFDRLTLMVQNLSGHRIEGEEQAALRADLYEDGTLLGFLQGDWKTGMKLPRFDWIRSRN